MISATAMVIIGTWLGVGGVALAVLIMRINARLDRKFADGIGNRRAFQAQAVEDRRRLRAGMDRFDADMRHHCATRT